MNRAEEKSIRLLQIEQLLWAHPEGLTRAEMARRLQVDRSVITKYLQKGHMPPSIYEDEEDGNRLKLDRSADLAKTAFNLHEVMVIHLATRLLATRFDKPNPHAASALRKLGKALQRLDRNVSQHLLRSADIMDEDNAFRDPVYLEVLEKLTTAWAAGRKIKVSHQLPDGLIADYVLSPYFIEPYAVGQTTHVIGWREPPDKIRTLKVERIRSAEILSATYQIPESFDPRSLLQDAWGIWYTEETPQQVVLKFHPRVAARVKESRWHRSQRIEEQSDGALIWQASIAEPQEMLPWIRGWGADVEVLEPESLRKTLERETKRLAKLYLLTETKEKPIAHIRKKDKDCTDPQYLWDHLSETSVLAKQFAGKIGLDKAGEVLGLLHDLGKASKEFQNYIRSATGLIDPDEDGYTDVATKKGKVDHSSAGAQIIYKRFWDKGGEGRIIAQILALPIASHHSGLIDCLLPSGEDNFTRRIQKLEDSTHVSEALPNLEEPERLVIEKLLADEMLVSQLIGKLKSLKEEKNDHSDTLAFKYGLLIRYLFSCVIDADRLNTADFEFPGNSRIRNYGQYHPWGTLIERLDAKLKTFENKTDKNEVDELRNQVSQACLDFASKPKGIYQLKVQTGGGKTLASLRFALNHAAKHKMDRVFYVIPYTSIIDQNADEVRKILEDQDESGQLLDRVVLEHHSNLTPEEETKRQNLLAENWDAPVVFTTQVQFLETLFGSGTRGARRMHQLANSVIIFDEIQTIPIRCVHMFNLAIRFLVNNCGATVVLCTATQPLLAQVQPPERALPTGQRMIQNESELFEKLKRVEAFDGQKVGGWTDEEVAERVETELQEKGSVLVIVNTKRSARSLYQVIAKKKWEDVYLCHLSTNMCPAHRLDVLNTVREKLETKQPIVCVSTQLIEAGVDVDFGSVIRYLAGLDSIIQAAGRCNRHGRRDSGNLWIVNPQDESIDKLKEIQIGAEKAKRILSDYNDNPEMFGNDRLGLAAVETYYRYYFHERQSEMAYPVSKDSLVGRADDLFNLLAQNQISVSTNQRISQPASVIPFKQSFQTAAKAFRVIDSSTRGVVVPYGKLGEEIIAELCRTFEIEKQYKLIKRAQRYSVNLLPHELKKMADNGAIQEVQEGSGILYLDSQYYDKQFGWFDEVVNDMPFLTA